MANAAAKKAASARKQAQGIYVPVILGLNVFYLLLKYLLDFWFSWVGWDILFLAIFAGTYYFVYQQILDNAANRSARDTSLIGGKALDILAVVAFIQLGTVFSTDFYWLLLGLPIWGAWSLYQTLMGKGGLMNGLTGGGAATAPPAAGDTEESGMPTNRKQRRTEQRKQRR